MQIFIHTKSGKLYYPDLDVAPLHTSVDNPSSNPQLEDIIFGLHLTFKKTK